MKTLDEALGRVDLGEVEVVAVSAGFDGHAGDLASLGLTGKGFKEIGKRIASLNKHNILCFGRWLFRRKQRKRHT